MTKKTHPETGSARSRLFGLLVVGGTLTMPILLVLLYIYVAGFSDRSLQENFFYPTILLTLALMEMLEALTKWSMWDRIVPKLSMTWRKNIARNLAFAFGFGCLVPDETEIVSVFLKEWAIATPFLFAIFCLGDLTFQMARRYWRKRKEAAKSATNDP